MALKLTCTVRLLPTAEGGRSTSLASEWRSLVWFGELWTESDAALWPEYGTPLPIGEELVYGCELRLEPDVAELAPGETANAAITLPFLDEVRPAIHPGAECELREGKRKVGTAQIVEVEKIGPRSA